VKICLYHKGKRVYIDTPHYITERKLTSIYTIKYPVLSRIVNKSLDDYRETVSVIGNKLKFLSAEELLRDYLILKNEQIDFIRFCKLHIDSLETNKQKKSAANYRTVRYSLIDYFQRESVSVNEITLGSIRGYEQYLRSDRNITRTNQFGKLVTTHSRNLSENSIHNYLRDFKGLYNAALSFYNHIHFDVVRIKHNPFEHFEINETTQTQKRNITIAEIRKIRDCKATTYSTAELARASFILIEEISTFFTFCQFIISLNLCNIALFLKI